MAGANRWTAALLAVALALGMAPTAVRPAPAGAVGRADAFKVENAYVYEL